jgi:hypothetical protein
MNYLLRKKAYEEEWQINLTNGFFINIPIFDVGASM